MSEESKTTNLQNEKITSVVKTKDPRRVEAGKRLGMISKQAKEKKLAQMRNKLCLQDKASAIEAKEKNDDWFPNTSIGSPVVGIGFVGLVGLALYYGYVKKYKTVSDELRSQDESASKSASHVKTEEAETVPEGRDSVVPKATSKTKPKRVYKELDTLD